MKKEITAMRIAGIACVIMLAAIGVFTFTTPSDEFVTYLALLGSLVGGKNHDGRIYAGRTTATNCSDCLLRMEMAEKITAL